MKTYDLTYFKMQDEEGNKFLKSIGVNSFGEVVAESWGCDKPDCQCAGTWSAGNESEVERWIHRPQDTVLLDPSVKISHQVQS